MKTTAMLRALAITSFALGACISSAHASPDYRLDSTGTLFSYANSLDLTANVNATSLGGGLGAIGAFGTNVSIASDSTFSYLLS